MDSQGCGLLDRERSQMEEVLPMVLLCVKWERACNMDEPELCRGGKLPCCSSCTFCIGIAIQELLS